ncbi:MAG TPA: hypothetical protein VIV60_21565 [Polyangiaceae bacterium]
MCYHVLRLDAALVMREPLVAIARIREAIAAAASAATESECSRSVVLSRLELGGLCMHILQRKIRDNVEPSIDVSCRTLARIFRGSAGTNHQATHAESGHRDAGS